MLPFLFCLSLAAVPVAGYVGFRFGVRCGIDALSQTIERDFLMIRKVRK